MDTMKIIHGHPGSYKIPSLSRYGCFSEQTYRNLLSMKL